jgi:hypothetical protein
MNSKEDKKKQYGTRLDKNAINKLREISKTRKISQSILLEYLINLTYDEFENKGDGNKGYYRNICL